MNVVVTEARSKFGELLHARNLWTIILGVVLTVSSFFVAIYADFRVYDAPVVRASGIMLAVGLFLAIGPFALKVLAWVYALAVVLRTGQQAEIPDALEAAMGTATETAPVQAPEIKLEGPVTTIQGPAVGGQNGVDQAKP